MRRLLVVLVMACSSKSTELPPLPPPTAPVAPAVPQGGSYADLVGTTQTGPADETRTSLACAAAIVIPTKREPAAADPSAPKPSVDDVIANYEARERLLNSLAGERLVREAKPDELYMAVLARILQTLDEKGPTGVTTAERAVQAYDLMTGELYNGGFHQYFFNSSGDDAPAARAAIAQIGPPELLSIFDCALTAFPDGKPSPDRQTRNNQLARWGERQYDLFEKLNTAFYAMDSVQPAIRGFIRAHAAEFPSIARPLRR